MNDIRFILASSSPRRRELLSQIDFSFDVIHPAAEESDDNNLSPIDLAIYNAKAKASSVSKLHPNRPVIGADTLVTLDGQILGKPKDWEDAVRMLNILSGNTHQVVTAVSLQWILKNIEREFVEETSVTFRGIPEKDILYYIDTYKPFDKAGSYGIQDWFSVNVTEIKGCYYNVVGFPLAAFYDRVQSFLGEAGRGL